MTTEEYTQDSILFTYETGVDYEALADAGYRPLVIDDSGLFKAVHEINGLIDRLSVADCEAVFQPLVDSSSGRIVGFESLAREKIEDGSLGGPVKLLEDINARGKNIDLYLHMLEQSCQFIKEAEALSLQDDFYVSINADIETLCSKGMVGETEILLRQYDVDPSRIVVEVIEDPFPNAENCQDAYEYPEDIDGYKYERAGLLNRLVSLEAMGIRVALDDFGTGRSDVYRFMELIEAQDYNGNYPITAVKFDREWLPSFTGDEVPKSFKRLKHSLMPQIMRMADKDMYAIVEGVETEKDLEVANLVFGEGQFLIQGFMFYKPLERDAAIQSLIENNVSMALEEQEETEVYTPE